mgnify:CR=1 FL=1
MKSTPKPSRKSIPVYQPDLSGNESEYVLRCIDTNWISSRGEFVERFEKGRWKILFDYDSNENGTIDKADFDAGFAMDDWSILIKKGN